MPMLMLLYFSFISSFSSGFCVYSISLSLAHKPFHYTQIRNICIYTYTLRRTRSIASDNIATELYWTCMCVCVYGTQPSFLCIFHTDDIYKFARLTRSFVHSPTRTLIQTAYSSIGYETHPQLYMIHIRFISR